jgi:PhnB protein
MPSRLNPYVMFDGTARAAMQFYESVFGGTLTLSTFGEAGAPEGVDPDALMHAMLETPDGFTLMASDVPPGMPHQPGTNISVSLSGDDADALRGWWQRLSEGGSVTVPLEKQMWGDEFGACTDRFGLGWMVNITGV